MYAHRPRRTYELEARNLQFADPYIGRPHCRLSTSRGRRLNLFRHICIWHMPTLSLASMGSIVSLLLAAVAYERLTTRKS